MKKIELTEWKTLLSEAKDLYFEKLLDIGKLYLTFSDGDKVLYDIVFDSYWSYKRTDEDCCTSYWNIKTFKGWTFKVKNSPLFNEIRETTDYFLDSNGQAHYAIASWDCCIEIFADKPPRIIKVE